MHIVIFEDDSYHQFYPITSTQPLFCLKAGIFSLDQKIRYAISSLLKPIPVNQISYIFRPLLHPLFPQFPQFAFSQVKPQESYLFISASFIPHPQSVFHNMEYSISQNRIASFSITGSDLEQFPPNSDTLQNQLLLQWFSKLKFKKTSHQGTFFHYLFQIVDHNPTAIQQDFQNLQKFPSFKQFIPLQSQTIQPYPQKSNFQVLIHPQAKIYPHTSFLPENGHILVDQGAVIRPFSLIHGPSYIGKNTSLEFARIHSSSIFQGCKISGEIQNSIILDFTNIAHQSFLGHSYIGSFVNFGAFSSNSNLKNNYNDIVLFFGEIKKNTLKTKVGAFVGDHSKFSIASLLNSGTIIGPACNLFNPSQFLPKWIPAFIWGGQTFQEYLFAQFVQTASKVLLRRSKNLPYIQKQLFSSIFVQEISQRIQFLKNYPLNP